MDQETKNIIKNKASSPWEDAKTRDELIDNLVDDKEYIASFISVILDIESDAQATSTENGDYIQLYIEQQIGCKHYNIIIFEYSMEELADFNSLTDLIKDIKDKEEAYITEANEYIVNHNRFN